MQVKNNSKTRPYHVGGVLIAPCTTGTVPDSAEADLKGEKDLELVGGPAIEEEKGLTKSQLQDALKEKGVSFSPLMNKADLQALLDGAK